jgi:hypothetical protein
VYNPVEEFKDLLGMITGHFTPWMQGGEEGGITRMRHGFFPAGEWMNRPLWRSCCFQPISSNPSTGKLADGMI